MNETYKWLYDYYALPLIKVGKQADALKERIVSHGSPADALFLWDRLEDCACCGARSPLHRAPTGPAAHGGPAGGRAADLIKLSRNIRHLQVLVPVFRDVAFPPPPAA